MDHQFERIILQFRDSNSYFHMVWGLRIIAGLPITIPIYMMLLKFIFGDFPVMAVIVPIVGNALVGIGFIAEGAVCLYLIARKHRTVNSFWTLFRSAFAMSCNDILRF